ncbi:Uncharacterised protein [Serratia fonticola]|nr:Uncharacterised protein [Serratia fonticola]
MWLLELKIRMPSKSITNSVNTVNKDNGTDGMFQVNNTSKNVKPLPTDNTHPPEVPGLLPVRKMP